MFVDVLLAVAFVVVVVVSTFRKLLSALVKAFNPTCFSSGRWFVVLEVAV